MSNARENVNLLASADWDIATLRLANWGSGAVPPQVMLKNNWVAGDEGGLFRYDASDTTTADNSGTVIVDAAGNRWKRQFDGVYRPEWFGDTSTGAGFTAALQATITAAGNNARITIPTGKTLTETITLLTAQVLQGRNGRSHIFKGFNGDMIDMSASQCGLEDIWLRGVGATYTGRGVVVTAANSYQYMENVWIYDTVGYALEFTVSNAGGSFRAERCTFQRTTATNPAIGLPTALDTAGNRRFINCSADGGWFLKFNSGINTWIIGCDFINLDFSASDGVSLRAVISGCRIATTGVDFAVWGNDSSITGNVIAGAGTLNGAASRNQIFGNALLAGTTWTDNSTATGTNINYIDYAVYSPTVLWKGDTADPAIGDGTLSTRVIRQGKSFTVNINLTVGSTTTFGTDAWYFELPAPLSTWSAAHTAVGALRMLDSGTAWAVGTAWIIAGTKKIYMSPSSGGAQVKSNAPFTWAAADQLNLSVEFEIT
jgi:hypothetical protein